MATYDHEEHERIDNVKTWWDKFGTMVMIVLTTLLVTIGGMQAWQYYQQKQIQQAADLFALLQQVQVTNDLTKINDAAHLLKEGFPASGYAPRAALIAAHAGIQAGDRKIAKQNLQWILDNAKEPEMLDLVRLRLAGILLDEEKYEDALRQLNSKHGEVYAGLYSDRKGDIYAASGKITEAQLAYQEAIEKLNKNNNYFNIVQMKLDALGEVQ